MGPGRHPRGRVILTVKTPRVRQVVRLHCRLAVTHRPALLITRVCRPVVLRAGMDGLHVENIRYETQL